MTKKNICYMAVQVVSRSPVTGMLLEWYDGDLHGTLVDAKADLKRLQKDYPNTDYVLVERVITEL